MRTPLRRQQSQPSSSRVIRKPHSQQENGVRRPPQGNPRELHQKYLTLAKEAITAGNIIDAEQFYQHAEHYYRLVMEHAQPHTS